MRLWHYKLIPVLPTAQLLGQWRECCAIASRWAENGTPNHALVNLVMDYGAEEFVQYCYYVHREMCRRYFNPSPYTVATLKDNFAKIHSRLECSHDTEQFRQLVDDIWASRIEIEKIFEHWHTDTYLSICYWNLLEKYMCGCIPPEEWIELEDWGLIQV